MVSILDVTASLPQNNVLLDSLIADTVFRRGARITYAFVNEDRVPSGTDGGRAWRDSGATAAFEGAVAEWEKVANLDIRRHPFTHRPGGDTGLITWEQRLVQLGSFSPLLGSHDFPSGRVQQGEFNSDHPFFSAANNARGGYSFLTFLHEIGHALGLEHPHEPGSSFPGVDNEDDPGDFGLNRTLNTVMSYVELLPDGSQSFDRSFGWQMTPGALDIAAVQAIYGANMSTEAGDTVWRLPMVNASGTGYASIWDAGGMDWLDAGDARADVSIDLRPATLDGGPNSGGWLSSARGFFGGFTIARGVMIENARGGVGDDTITGNAGNNIIEAGAGFDRLIGLDGNDTLIGGAGFDTLDGGAGADVLIGGSDSDVYTVDSQDDVIFEDADGGIDLVNTTTSFYLYANIENLLLTGSGDLFGVGNSAANSIIGTDGSNLLLGGGGADSVVGGAGNDALFGEAGDDMLEGEGGIDYLVGGDGADWLIGGADADALYGESGDDVLWGGDGFFTDILVGGDGNDQLFGGMLGDFDLMDGGSGDDRYFVDTPADLTFEAADGGIDTVIADINGAGYYLYPHVENLQLTGATPFGVGNGLDNGLNADAGTQWLLGGAGDDRLDAGPGDDVLFGESGADVFVFNGARAADFVPVQPGDASGRDVIGDFQPGTDRLDIIGYGITSFAQLSAGFVEVAGTTAVNFGNGNFVVLNGVALASLTAADFLFG